MARRPPERYPQLDPVQFSVVGIAVVVSGIVLVMLGVIFWLSFTSGPPGGSSLVYTTGHYAEVLLAPITYRVLFNTVLFSAITLVVAVGLGLPMGWLIERTDFPGKPVVFTLMTVGLLLPGFAVALGWLLLLHPRIGVLNRMIMGILGLSQAPINIETTLGMGIVNGLTLAPLAFVMTGVALRSMDSTLEEAASMSGAAFHQVFGRITLPLAWPGVLATGIYIFAIGFASFDVPAILGLPSRIYTFSTLIFEDVTANTGLPDYGGVATLSVVMAVLAGILSWWYLSVHRHIQRYAVITGKGYRPRQAKLGRFKFAAVLFVAGFFLLSELLPILMLVWAAGLPFLQPLSMAAATHLSWENFRALSPDLLIVGLKTTGILMVVVPTATIITSLAISWTVLRTQIRGRGIFDFCAFLPHAIPSIVFAIAAWLLALFVLPHVLPLYGTIWLLVLVYVIARISYGTRMMNGALIQVHPELEESARLSGANTGAIMHRVLLPLLTPAILYTWIWVALLTYRELTLAVLLATNDNEPLTMVVWGLLWSSAYGKASAVSLIMIGVMTPVLCLYWMIVQKIGAITPE